MLHLLVSKKGVYYEISEAKKCGCLIFFLQIFLERSFRSRESKRQIIIKLMSRIYTGAVA